MRLMPLELKGRYISSYRDSIYEAWQHKLVVDVNCRYDSHSGGEREIQRTMLELLNQLDGFDSRGDVKVCMIF